MIEVETISKDARVMIVEAHHCQFGLTAQLRDGSGRHAPAKKRTGFMTHIWFVAEAFNRKCQGGHPHAWLTEGRAAKAAVYPDGLCEAVCLGTQRQIAYELENTTRALCLHGKTWWDSLARMGKSRRST